MKRLIPLVLTSALVACAPGAGKMTLAASDFGGAWPFTPPRLDLVCGRSLAIFVKAGDKAYAMNGQAERRPELYRFGPVANLSEIVRPDPEGSKMIPGERMSTE